MTLTRGNRSTTPGSARGLSSTEFGLSIHFSEGRACAFPITGDKHLAMAPARAMVFARYWFMIPRLKPIKTNSPAAPRPMMASADSERRRFRRTLRRESLIRRSACLMTPLPFHPRGTPRGPRRPVCAGRAWRRRRSRPARGSAASSGRSPPIPSPDPGMRWVHRRNHRHVAHQRPRDGDALALPARQGAGALAGLGGDADRFQRLNDAPAHLAAGESPLQRKYSTFS